MRILFLHNHHAGLGGAMEVLAHESELLASAGHDVEVFALPAAHELGLSGVRAGAKAVWNREATRELSERVRRRKPDVAHVHTPFPLLSPAVFRRAADLGVPTVTTVHSYRYSCIAATCFRDGAVCEDCVGKRLKLPGLVHRCYHDSVGASAALTASLALHKSLGTFRTSVNRFITLTPFSKRLLIRDGVPAEHIVVKANSVVDPGSPKGCEEQVEKPYVAFAGRLIDVKGVETLLNAWRHMGGGLTLKIAGDGPLRPLVEERAASDPTIETLGWLSEADIYDLMRDAVCVVAPSEWYEGGVPLVAIRSMAVGTPVIVSDLENIAEDVLADGAGLAFRTGDASSLAKVLTTLRTDAAEWKRRGAAARASYEKRHTPQTTLTSLERIYSEVIEEGSRPRMRR